MKKFFLIFFATFLFASTQAIKDLIGNKYYTYKNLINQTIPKNASLEETILALKENGLIDLFFKYPRIFKTTFIFKDKNPQLDTKILYDVLKNMGYFYFYPSAIDNSSNYVISIEMKSKHYIDPLEFLREMKNYNCNVLRIQKSSRYFYTINCQNATLNAKPLTDEIQNLSNPSGEYWIYPNNFRKIYIKTSTLDKWHPYVVFYDDNLNILNIISSSNIKRTLISKIPYRCQYIKIKDNFSKENIKRGIFIKGIK